MKLNKDKCKSVPVGRKKPLQLGRPLHGAGLGVLVGPKLSMGWQ